MSRDDLAFEAAPYQSAILNASGTIVVESNWVGLLLFLYVANLIRRIVSSVRPAALTARC